MKPMPERFRALLIGGTEVAGLSHAAIFPGGMLKTYIVYYRYKVPSEKGPGPVRQFRLNAATLEEARRMATTYGNYPNLEILNIRQA